jgi:hypothetical protein
MDVALVGVAGPGIENHSLGVLAGALDAAGLRHTEIAFAGFAGMDAMISDVLAAAPRVLGLSLQTTESLLAGMTFTRLLRARGFAGTIVVGGHVATLAADAILAASTGVDAVVRLAGERALVGLARGEDPRSLPGVVTRDGGGLPPIAVMPVAARRERMTEHLGFAVADLISSRGCEAHCGYCCVAAASDLAAQVGGERRTAHGIDQIADEIAATGARALHWMDDNLLPLDPADAVAWVRALHAALRTRDVPPIAFSLQLRADVVTSALADALVELGLVRAYVGIDGYTQRHLRAIGRSSPARAGHLALEALASRGILCVANALAIGPTIAFDTVVDMIDGLAEIRHAPVHLLPIEARPGTPYHRRAAARGLIEGGPLWPVYRFEDERTFLVGEVLTGLPTRLAERSVPIALYDLAWGLGVARRLVPEARVEADTYAAVTAAWNADQVRVLRAAVAAAREGRAAIDELLARERAFTRAHDDALLATCDRALTDVERAVAAVRRRPARAQTRGRLLGEIAITMGLASACSSSNKHPAVDAAVVVDSPAVCADTSRMAEPGPSELDMGCTCNESLDMTVQVTFDSHGVITAIRDASGNPLPGTMESCLLALVAGYCYPSQAGMTATFPTCHAWIA